MKGTWRIVHNSICYLICGPEHYIPHQTSFLNPCRLVLWSQMFFFSNIRVKSHQAIELPVFALVTVSFSAKEFNFHCLKILIQCYHIRLEKESKYLVSQSLKIIRGDHNRHHDICSPNGACILNVTSRYRHSLKWKMSSSLGLNYHGLFLIHVRIDCNVRISRCLHSML